MELIKDTPFGVRWGVREPIPGAPHMQVAILATLELSGEGACGIASQQDDPGEEELRPPGRRTACVVLGPFAQGGSLTIGGFTKSPAMVPTALQLEGALLGEEALALAKLHPKRPELSARLPGRRARAFLEREGAKALAEIPLVLDRLQLDLSADRVLITWRGSVPTADAGAGVAHLFVIDEPLDAPKEDYAAWLKACLAGQSRRRPDASEAVAAAPAASPELKAPLLDLSDELRKAELERFMGKVRGMAVDEGATTLILEGAGPSPLDAVRAAQAAQAAQASQRAASELEAPSFTEEMPTLIAEEGGGIHQGMIAALAAQSMAAQGATKRASGLSADSGLETVNLKKAEAEEPSGSGWSTEVRSEIVHAALEGRSCAGRDLRRADLSELDLSELDLRGADLRGANLHDTVLDRAILEDARLDGAILERCFMQESHCARASFVGIRGAEVDFSSADLSGADFTGADLREATVVSALLVGASMRAASAPGACFDYSDLSGLSAAQASLSGASFVQARLVGAALGEADLEGAILDGAVFEDPA